MSRPPRCYNSGSSLCKSWCEAQVSSGPIQYAELRFISNIISTILLTWSETSSGIESKLRISSSAHSTRPRWWRVVNLSWCNCVFSCRSCMFSSQSLLFSSLTWLYWAFSLTQTFSSFVRSGTLSRTASVLASDVELEAVAWLSAVATFHGLDWPEASEENGDVLPELDSIISGIVSTLGCAGTSKTGTEKCCETKVVELGGSMLVSSTPSCCWTGFTLRVHLVSSRRMVAKVKDLDSNLRWHVSEWGLK